MAYSTLLASVADGKVIAFRERKEPALKVSLSVHCSHALTSWVRHTELRLLLRQAMDEGQVLRADLWHPLRSPIWHPAASASKIATAMSKVWSGLIEQHGPPAPNDWYGTEISKVLRVFEHAAASENGVVSFLERPVDSERGDRVSIPVMDESG